jgi:catechol 2,3-dioxygenase-like lactoylglutathione lyase family enzyme
VSAVEGLSAVTVHVTDIHAARKFYRDVLGLREAGFTEQTARAVYVVPGSPIAFVAHGIIFHHHDPRAAVEEIRRLGGTVTLEPIEVPGPGGMMVRAAVADPDGNEFVISTGHASPAK